MVANYKKSTVIFLLVITFFILRGIYYCFFIPPWEAPDEPGHVKYVLNLYKNKELPSDRLRFDIGSELVRSWNYQKKYILPPTRSKKNNPVADLFNRNKYKPERGTDNITSYPPLYYVYLLPFYFASLPFPSYISLIFLRFGSVVIGTISLIIIRKIAQIFFSKPQICNLAIFLIALDPMYTFISSVVNSDVMVIFAFALFFYVCLKYIILSERPALRNSMWVSFIVGLSTLSKPQMLVMVPIYLVVLFIKTGLTSRMKVFLMFIAIIIPLLWYVIAGHSSVSYSLGTMHTHVLPIWQYPSQFFKDKQLIGIFMSFWGFFGWLDVPMPKWIYVFILAILLIATGGWILGIKKGLKASGSLKKAFLFTVVMSIGYILTVVSYDVAYFLSSYHFALQGRYFLPVLFVLIFGIIKGILLYSNKVRQILIISIILVFILSQIIMYSTISSYYYHAYFFISPLSRIYL